jgi:surface protein
MEGLFSGTLFNQPLSTWNVLNVTTMQAMFYNNTQFNQNINNWNVSKVTNMSFMFYFASQFNPQTSVGPFIGNWNVSNVENMQQMFSFATAFNQNISNWNVTKVTQWTDFGFQSGLSTENTPVKFR